MLLPKVVGCTSQYLDLFSFQCPNFLIGFILSLKWYLLEPFYYFVLASGPSLICIHWSHAQDTRYLICFCYHVFVMPNPFYSIYHILSLETWNAQDTNYMNMNLLLKLLYVYYWFRWGCWRLCWFMWRCCWWLFWQAPGQLKHVKKNLDKILLMSVEFPLCIWLNFISIIQGWLFVSELPIYIVHLK